MIVVAQVGTKIYSIGSIYSRISVYTVQARFINDWNDVKNAFDAETNNKEPYEKLIVIMIDWIKHSLSIILIVCTKYAQYLHRF